MNFQTALILLKQGKKVRRSHWHKHFFLRMDYKGDVLEMGGHRNFPMKYNSIMGTDWEVFEEFDDTELTQSLLSLIKKSEKYPDQAIELLNQYFPKGDKKRGEAMVILSMAWLEGKEQRGKK
jgi:hypothetical protein